MNTCCSSPTKNRFSYDCPTFYFIHFYPVYYKHACAEMYLVMDDREETMKWLLTSLILVLMTLGSASAQDKTSPLLILRLNDDTVYQYQDGQVTPLQACTPQGEKRQLSQIWVSPDGLYYAFLTSAPNATSAANNLRLCDLQNERLLTITGQPQTDVIHSAPAWSLDGTKLAFVRLFQGADRLEFVIYDLASRAAEVVYQRYMDVSAGSLPPDVVWGAVGPIIFNINADGQSLAEFSEYVWYPQEFIAQDKEGEAVVRKLTLYFDSIQVITQADGAMSYLVSNYDQPGKLLDLATNEVVDMPAGTLVKINPLDNTTFGQSFVMNSNGVTIINGPDYSADLGITGVTNESLSISPDGSAFAFITFEDYPYGGKVYVVDDVNRFLISTGKSQREGVTHLSEFDAHYGEPGALALFWGPFVMMLRPD